MQHTGQTGGVLMDAKARYHAQRGAHFTQFSIVIIIFFYKLGCASIFLPLRFLIIHQFLLFNDELQPVLLLQATAQNT